VHSGFKHIRPTPSAYPCYEGFTGVFYSLLSPFGCLCCSKSHAPYGRVYFSLYGPGMHFEYCCEQSAKAKGRSLVPPVLLFNTSLNTHHHLWLKGLPLRRWAAGGDGGPKLSLSDLSRAVRAGSRALELLGMPLGHRLISSGKEPSSVKGLCCHGQRRLHSEQPAPGEVLDAGDGHFEFQNWEDQGIIWGWEETAGN